jgi:hypothetical protein
VLYQLSYVPGIIGPTKSTEGGIADGGRARVPLVPDERDLRLSRSATHAARVACMSRPKTVLVVDLDGTERDRFGAALEDAGFHVLSCPGPSAPDYTCVGARERQCPLVDRADVVVLDLWTSGDEIGVGTPGEELLELYVSSGRPVVALGPGGYLADPTQNERVARLEEHAAPGAIVDAVGLLA